MMNNIERHSGNNYGGICSIKLININNVLNINSIVNDNEYKASVNLKSGYSWNEIYFTPDTENFDESEKTTDNASYWLQKLEFSIPKDRQNVLKELRDLSFNQLIARVKYDNGDEILIGNIENPMRKTNNRIIKNISTNLYNISLESRTINPSYFYYEVSEDSDS